IGSPPHALGTPDRLFPALRAAQLALEPEQSFKNLVAIGYTLGLVGDPPRPPSGENVAPGWQVELAHAIAPHRAVHPPAPPAIGGHSVAQPDALFAAGPILAIAPPPVNQG